MVDAGLQVPDPEVSVTVHSVVAPWVTVTVSVLGMPSPWPEATLVEKTRLVSAP